MKLLLNTILPYAAYKVKYAYRDPVTHEKDYEAELDIFNKDELNCLVNYSEYFLLLRPLSDLTKEIEVSGEKFIPFSKIVDLFFEWTDKDRVYYDNNLHLDGTTCINYNIGSEQDDILLMIEQYDIFSHPYKIIEKLFEWHFDIFGLIDQRKAIDINTI